MYYQSNYPNYEYQFKNNDRQFFLAPLLLGGLGGAAIVSATRPRPVFVNPPMYSQPYYPPYGYNYYGGHGFNPYR